MNGTFFLPYYWFSRFSQSSLFQIFNGLIRSSSDAREAVLQYFARVISLNNKRAGTHVSSNFFIVVHELILGLYQVDPETVASDSFMVNLQSVLYKFADPFIDATYSKVGGVLAVAMNLC